ncbi:TPA: replication endonuclease [Pseudomonas aeruginosa]|uniref:replication endonuclease n=1 Tax=Pseudomonas aeruginosa TaxID=287 RepID=UPI00136CD5C7|nr:replication endonuclease [Pseudomonas aeruginosa]MXU52372.1 hypothetical protein [Pseudomonas aeruginosa]HBN9846902.1 replication endonuclease [Pseudomonas aeruginosa]HBN9848098.1 replication endonuclease [Pseudomonas aeruginosa]
MAVVDDFSVAASYEVLSRQTYLDVGVDYLAECEGYELIALAKEIADRHRLLLSRCTKKEKAEHVRKAHEFGVLVRAGKSSNTDSLAQRLIDKRWWRRQISKKADERREHLAQISKELGRDAGQICCTERTMRLMHERKIKAREFMASSYKIISSTVGTENPVFFSLAEVDRNKQSSRLNELFLDIKALEEIAKSREWEWMLITLTAAPEYHSNPAMGRNSYDEELKAGMANRAIASDWKAVRGYLKERGFKPSESFFGVRVTEVHDDGCPHWHILMFHELAVLQHVRDAVSGLYKGRPGSYFEEHKDEIIKVGRKEGEDNAAAASSYIFKYLSFALMSDCDDELDLSVQNRYRCAIKAMGARQYQMFGVKSSRGKLRALSKVKGKDGVPINIKAMADSMYINKVEGDGSDELERLRRKKQLDARVAFFLGGSELLSFEYEKYTNSYGEEVERVLAIKHVDDEEGVQIGGLTEDIGGAKLEALLSRQREKCKG